MSNTLALVGDVGGTNARFALTDLAAPTVELHESKSLPNAEFASMQHAIEHYLAEVGARPARAADNAAGKGLKRSAVSAGRRQ